MQEDYKILPKRNGRSDGSFQKMPVVSYFTNFYEIGLKTQSKKIYQYDIKLESDIPQDSELYDRAVRSIRNTLKEDIGYLTHKGQMIWGNKETKVTLTLNCRFEFQDSQYELEALISKRKEATLDDLNDDKLRPQLLQVLNVNLKQALKNAKLFELGKTSKFFEQGQMGEHPDLQEIGLDVIRGFKLTLVQLNRGICLQVDTSSRVLQSKNMLEIFGGMNQNAIKEMVGSTVITKYGKYKTYKIQEIDFDLSPKSTFHNESKGCNMSYEEYYKNVYGLKVKNSTQPLLKVVGRIRKEIKKGKIQETPEYIYLIPEFVSPTGMTDDQRANHQTMKALSPYTKLTPNQRIKDCSRIINTLNQSASMIEIKGNIRMDGYCLPRPELAYNGATKIKPDQKGSIRHRGLLKEPFHFTDWMFVYGAGKNASRDDNDADKAVEILTKAGQTYGLKFKDPGFLSVSSNRVDDWMKNLEKDINDNGIPQIVVVYLAPYEEKYYSKLKTFLTNQLKCPSQFIRKKTLTNPKGAMSAASKICIQMNIKVGATPWAVQTKHDYFRKKNVMYGAISISKGSKGNTLAFVGTINNECTKVYSDCKIGIKSKESIPVKDLENMFVDWAKSYFQNNNKKVPETIIIYREGLTDAQSRDQLPRTEIPALENMAQVIGDKTKTKNYKPQFMVVLVNKKINNRFFNTGRTNPQQPNKFIPELFNPDSGSVIIEAMSSNDEYDFHLASQLVTQGTCTPTQFKVAYDTTGMSQEALIEFTFNQCFNYYNWQGAVRVPACLQCANKLSKLVGENIKQNIVQSALTKKHFFL